MTPAKSAVRRGTIHCGMMVSLNVESALCLSIKCAALCYVAIPETFVSLSGAGSLGSWSSVRYGGMSIRGNPRATLSGHSAAETVVTSDIVETRGLSSCSCSIGACKEHWI